MIFCAISIQNTQGPIGPGQWKLGLKMPFGAKSILAPKTQQKSSEKWTNNSFWKITEEV